ncbi:MAG: hypothetical protein IJC38_02575 [Erysipelotrichaceae bacterium]|nr:hypothetical protein [Erysipelotrichaceae bacterium]
MENKKSRQQLFHRNQNQKKEINTNNLINQSSQQHDDYYKKSNSSNHSQLEAAEEFAIEEDMIELQHQTKDVQQFNTQNFYNRQHYAGNRVVPQDKNFKGTKK